MAQINPKKGSNQTTLGVSHTRSMSQPPFFGNPGLPPLSPYPPNESSNSNFKNLSLEEMDVSSLLSPAALLRCNNTGLPPRRGHRRSNSDVALGFSAMIQSSAQLVPISGQEVSGRAINIPPKGREFSEIKPEGEVVDELLDSLMNMDALNGCGVDGKDKDSVSSGSKMSCGDGSNSDSENVSRPCMISRERVKRSAEEDIIPPFRHSRSLSMDSGIGKFLFADSLASNSLNENLARMDVGHGGFSEAELKKIAVDERLAVIAISDPKKARRYT